VNCPLTVLGIVRGLFLLLGMGVNLVDKKSAAALTSAMETERTEELVGVLTAISVVSRRLAKKLAQLEKQSADKGVGGTDERKCDISRHPG